MPLTYEFAAACASPSSPQLSSSEIRRKLHSLRGSTGLSLRAGPKLNVNARLADIAVVPLAVSKLDPPWCSFVQIGTGTWFDRSPAFSLDWIRAVFSGVYSDTESAVLPGCGTRFGVVSRTGIFNCVLTGLFLNPLYRRFRRTRQFEPAKKLEPLHRLFRLPEKVLGDYLEVGGRIQSLQWTGRSSVQQQFEN